MKFAKSFSLLLIVLIFFQCTQTKIYQELKKESQPPKELTRWQNLQRGFWDFLILEQFGVKSVLQKNEQFIRRVQKELNMQDYNIEIRAMNRFAQSQVVRKSLGHLPFFDFWQYLNNDELLGCMNAFVIPAIFNPRSNHHLMYIYEDWFITLTEKEKKALIGRELMYIRKNCINKKLLFFFISVATSITLKFTLGLNEDLPFLAKTNLFGLTLPFILINLWFNRRCEKEIDLSAAKELLCADGSVDLWNRFIEDNSTIQSRFKVKQILFKVIRPFICFFTSSHPTPETRRDYLQELAKEQAQAKSVAVAA